MPAWAARYIGVPFVEHGRTPEGWDCWGLARHIWRVHFGIVVDSYAEEYVTAMDGAAVSRLILGAIPGLPWRPVTDGAMQPGDGLLFRIDGYPAHVGVLLARDHFLHVDRTCATVLDRLTSPRWRRRWLGAYRYSG